MDENKWQKHTEIETEIEIETEMTLFKQQNVFFDESSTDIVTHQTCDYPKNHFFFYKISTYFYNKISHIKNLAFGKMQS